MQPKPGTQKSLVHAFPSLHAIFEFWHWPVEVLHESNNYWLDTSTKYYQYHTIGAGVVVVAVHWHVQTTLGSRTCTTEAWHCWASYWSIGATSGWWVAEISGACVPVIACFLGMGTRSSRLLKALIQPTKEETSIPHRYQRCKDCCHCTGSRIGHLLRRPHTSRYRRKFGYWKR